MTNDNQDPKAINGEPTPVEHTGVTMNVQLGMLINMKKDDPRIEQVFKAEDFQDFLAGPLSVVMLTMIQQWVVGRCPEMLIMAMPAVQPGQKQETH